MKKGDIAVVVANGRCNGAIYHNFDIGSVVEIIEWNKTDGDYSAVGKSSWGTVDQWISPHHVEKLGEL